MTPIVDSTVGSVVTGAWRALGDERYELGEGARILDGHAVFVDLLAGRLMRVDPAAAAAPVPLVTLDVPLGAVAPARAGGLIAAAGTGIAQLTDDGTLTWIDQPATAGPVALRMNDGCADPAGRFWAGSMAWDTTPGAGALYRVDPDGAVQTVVPDLTIPNGPAFTADGAIMYLADTARSVIYRFPVDPDTGNLGPREVFARVDGNPDGMTVDADGLLWVAIWGGGCLHRYAPDGTLIERIDVPARQPTSIAITPDPPYLAIVTTAGYGLADPTRDDGRVLVAPVTVAGQPLSTFG